MRCGAGDIGQTNKAGSLPCEVNPDSPVLGVAWTGKRSSGRRLAGHAIRHHSFISKCRYPKTLRTPAARNKAPKQVCPRPRPAFPRYYNHGRSASQLPTDERRNVSGQSRRARPPRRPPPCFINHGAGQSRRPLPVTGANRPVTTATSRGKLTAAALARRARLTGRVSTGDPRH